jgi:TetR/AcrR family transcriptional repressor of mexJK operon
LSAAADLIIERGYDGTNLDAICERAACSKSSIYAYFGNKEGLLSALTEDIALDLSQALHAFHLQHMSIEDALRRYARLSLRLILDEKHIAIVRATISTVWKYPQLGPAYYEVGALTAQSALAQYFAAKANAGGLNIVDATAAAKEFQALLLWDRMLAQVVGARSRPGDAELEADADAAVETFLRRYRVTR